MCPRIDVEDRGQSTTRCDCATSRPTCSFFHSISLEDEARSVASHRWRCWGVARCGGTVFVFLRCQDVKHFMGGKGCCFLLWWIYCHISICRVLSINYWSKYAVCVSVCVCSILLSASEHCDSFITGEVQAVVAWLWSKRDKTQVNMIS